MWLALDPIPEIPTNCPTCAPDLGPETYVVAWCGQHRPTFVGSCDELARVAAGQDYIMVGEAGGEPNR
jgi:hypothetical protein